MKLSIVIVNYNVKYFIEQAIYAVRHALKNIQAEIIVVDNASSDGSIVMLQEKFPEVILIANIDNKGFSTANNQGINIAKGEYILLLNPDTVVQEDTFEKSLQFMDERPDAGALGVKMIDGKGNFLPESKRGLPTPLVAFYKTFGLSALFPKSKTFNEYHLGYLSENENHEVAVLAGAFMLLRKTVLDTIGWLDEDFFMYGEDIDLSYRVTKAGYKNYYLADTRIIHYKGESTKKGSLNYVRIFYQAMIIFAQKHYSPRQAKFYIFFIRAAVYLRAIIAGINRFTAVFLWPILDSLLLYLGITFIKNFWAQNIKNATEYYPLEYSLFIIPAYIITWLLAVYFNGGYDKPVKNHRIIRGIIAGTILISALYAFFPESLRFSRAIILLGAAWAVASMIGVRFLAQLILRKKIVSTENILPKIIIAGTKAEGKRALNLLIEAGINHRFLGFVLCEKNFERNENILGNIDELQDICSIYNADEIIFCSKDIPNHNIISWMTLLGTTLNYKIIPEGSMSIIGSNSKNTAGDLYAIDVNLNIASTISKRNKRLFDVAFSLSMIVLFPLIFWVVNNKFAFFKNIFSVLIGQKTWVGYEKNNFKNNNYQLPKIKKSILTTAYLHPDKTLTEETKARLNLLYAKDYEVYTDWQIVINNLSYLGNQ